MAYFAWIGLLVALLGHSTSANSFYSHSDKPDVDIGLLPRPPPITPVGLNDTLLSDATVLRAREDKKPDPTDLSWIRRWAAIGDSFTAGIGAGNLYRQTDEDKRCSRYDRSYAAKLEQAIGDADFQYLACSGDRTMQIYQQIKKLEGDLDFVIMTGGGNDLCLADIIKTCILLPFSSEDDCKAVIETAQHNINGHLEPSIRDLLGELNNKMHKDGLVLYVLYAEFFNTETEKCGLDQEWSLIGSPLEALPLTKERRKRFNRLVTETNNRIEFTIQNKVDLNLLNYRIRTVNWNEWVKTGVQGQFCLPGTRGEYPDKGQPDLHFFKPNTASGSSHKDLKKKRDESAPPPRDMRLFDSRLFKSTSPAAEAHYRLDPRGAPHPPGCPSDGDEKPPPENEEEDEDDKSWWERWKSSHLGVPDGIGRYFHPNELGHTAIASFALQEIYNARSEALLIGNPLCNKFDKFECFNKDGWAKRHWRRYAAVEPVVDAMQDFCKNRVDYYTMHPSFTRYEKVYYRNMADQVRFTLSVNRTTDPEEISDEVCLDSFSRIIHGCDGLDPENPMNLKYGGMWIRGYDEFRVSMDDAYVLRVPLVNAPPKASGQCVYKKKADTVKFWLEGARFAGWDAGQHTILPELERCIGGKERILNWQFEYVGPAWPSREFEASYEVPKQYFQDKEWCLLAVLSNAAGENLECIEGHKPKHSGIGYDPDRYPVDRA